jgi:hypothetical protein
MDDRTLRAALVADLIGFASVAGIALFLGVPLLPAIVAGAIAGTLFFFLIWAAGKRSATFHDPAPPAPSEDDRA